MNGNGREGRSAPKSPSIRKYALFMENCRKKPNFADASGKAVVCLLGLSLCFLVLNAYFGLHGNP